MGRQWPVWWHSGERERRLSGPGESWRRLGWSVTSERVRRAGAAGSGRFVGGSVVRGGGRESTALCGIEVRRWASLATGEASVGPGGPCVLPQGTREGGGEGPHPPWICRVEVLRWVRLMWRRLWQLVQVGSGSPFGVDVVAGQIRFLVGGGWPWWLVE